MAEQDEKTKDFALEDFKLKPISSAENIKATVVIDENEEDILSLNALPPVVAATAAKTADGELDLSGNAPDAESAESTPTEEIEDPIFKELSAPKLPELAREDRARLQMQSPNKIHFYWSFKENPYKILSRIFGSRTNYQLVAKLQNQTSRREELFPIETDGSAWFDVEADASYLVEIGFYAVSRPFVRVLFSNALHTPRKSPSTRQDYSERFAVSANQFAKVLDVSGYRQDAYEVALAGDDIEAADRATETAFSQIFEAAVDGDFEAHQSSEMRFVLLALASGYALEDLRSHVSPSLFAFLRDNIESLSAEKALTALQENFGAATDEFEDEAEESFGAAVFGASSINFPRHLKRRALPGTLPKFSPISSLR